MQGGQNWQRKRMGSENACSELELLEGEKIQLMAYTNHGVDRDKVKESVSKRWRYHMETVNYEATGVMVREQRKKRKSDSSMEINE